MRPPKRKRMSPQEKKAASYARDGRNCYGQNDKASRKRIPLKKAQEKRAARREDKAALAAAPEEAAPAPPRRPGWGGKHPDLPLGASLGSGHGDATRPGARVDGPDWGGGNLSSSEWRRERIRARLRALKSP